MHANDVLHAANNLERELPSQVTPADNGVRIKINQARDQANEVLAKLKSEEKKEPPSALTQKQMEAAIDKLMEQGDKLREQYKTKKSGAQTAATPYKGWDYAGNPNEPGGRSYSEQKLNNTLAAIDIQSNNFSRESLG